MARGYQTNIVSRIVKSVEDMEKTFAGHTERVVDAVQLESVNEDLASSSAIALIHPAFPKYRRYSVRREGDSAIRIIKL